MHFLRCTHTILFVLILLYLPNLNNRGIIVNDQKLQMAINLGSTTLVKILNDGILYYYFITKTSFFFAVILSIKRRVSQMFPSKRDQQEH